MSLILDALKRAERERRNDPMPGVELPGLARPRRRRVWLRILGGIALGLVALVVLAVTVRLVRGKRASQPAQATRTLPANAQPQIQARAAPSLSPAPTPTPAAAPVIPGTESVSTLDELSEPEPPPPAVASASPPPRTQTPAAPAAGDRNFGQVTAAATPPPEAAPESGQPGEREVPPALTQPAPLRKLREMPPEFRADFPLLNVQVHNYERESAQRFVIVNDRRYHEGENLAEGPKLVEIVREGMVLEFRGEKLLYPMGR